MWEKCLKTHYTPSREGILNFNKANAHRITHRYNETITSFFLHLISLALDADRLSASQNPISQDNEHIDEEEDDVFASFLERYPFLEDRKLMYTFYSKAVLHSDEAADR